ncbi:MAG: 3-hydroxybutyrate dehydrogenase [Hyphomicrobium sp.]|nr:MAG: 3-hydroxybutyrate dehydrogenase [Hyphomicrobium sp.]
MQQPRLQPRGVSPGASEFAGKTALVTGSTSGIGLGIAKAFAAVGLKVAINGSGATPAKIAEGEKLAAGLAARYETEVVFLKADLRQPAEAPRLVSEVSRAIGPVDVLVNNAGVQHVSAVEDFPADKWDEIIALNLSAAFHATRAVVPGMKARKWGRIVNVASAHALVASPMKSAYVAAKHGLNGLTKTVALEVAEHGITVNALCPGYVLTPLVERQIPDTAKARGMTEMEVVRDVLLKAQPTRQFVTAEEVAAAAVFLCSDGARSITGIALPLDGGWTAQ